MRTRNKLYPRHPDGRTTIHRGSYNSWRAMRERCYGKKYWARKHYAGKGIEVCSRWLGIDGFSNFLADMGDRPEGCSLDRIDNNGDYCPENCRWVDQKAQIANSSKVLNALVTKEELSNAVCSMSVVYDRLKKGWSKEDALYKPTQQWKKAAIHVCSVCGKTWSRKDTKYCSRECWLSVSSLKKRDALGRFVKKGGDAGGKENKAL